MNIMFGGFGFKLASLTDFCQKMYDNTYKTREVLTVLFSKRFHFVHIVIYILG